MGFVKSYQESFDFFIFLYLGFFVTRLRTLLLRGTSSVTFDIKGKPTRCFATSFALVLFFFLQILCRRFLGDGPLDLGQIFRDDATSSEVCTAATIFKNLLPVGSYRRFTIFKSQFCRSGFTKTSKDRELKFSEMIELPFFWCTSV